MRHIKTISEFYRSINLPAPQHPLISVLDVATAVYDDPDKSGNMVLDFYSIAVKLMGNVSATYGQHTFDFDEGIMSFMSPNQVFSLAADDKNAAVKKLGWAIYIHPDFIWNTPLARSIRQYDFWGYSLHEALFLSAREEAVMNTIIRAIQQECEANIDQFSKPIIIAHLESLLNYADRFYHRQFLTREKAAHQLLDRLETVLDAYFNRADGENRGLPSVRYVAGELNLSPKYLSTSLRVLTGQNTQQHIHEKLIEKAKEKLSTTELTVGEIAYELGFEHLPSFSKLFKSQTNQSPLAFRASFN
ncbi:helix-turn-helix domain-containing protein [Spirosoma utsteinense]|uniref:AraC-like DNA-binding protein n=1 Tax=Spirosoma utsteinense TaxID=2585773 RepID=A0ABR6WE51_9BACT|nr:AraC family transcriptional regulator [Spirosoma utsteinense]MBC3788879.1 AraC-like DNA-binding protein [Spirosoma utsteinense]MBC3794820.1 AraC-like DNA-binding protein [Spirosoma utsteinense]